MKEEILIVNALQLDEREVQLQLLIQLQTEYQLSQQDVTRRMDEAQNQLDKVKPGGAVSELETQLNQLQVKFEFFSLGKEKWDTELLLVFRPKFRKANEGKKRSLSNNFENLVAKHYITCANLPSVFD